MLDNPITANDFLVLRVIDDALDRADFSENGNARTFIRRLIDSVEPALEPGEYVHAWAGVRTVVTFDGEAFYFDEDKAAPVLDINRDNLTPLPTAVTEEDIERAAIVAFNDDDSVIEWSPLITEDTREELREYVRTIFHAARVTCAPRQSHVD